MQIVEEDDGSGWVKAMDDSGGKGLVPASYLVPVEPSEAAHSRASPPRGGTQGHRQQGSGQYGKIVASVCLVLSTDRVVIQSVLSMTTQLRVRTSCR